MIFILIFLIGVFVGAMIWAMQDYIRNTRFHGGDESCDVNLDQIVSDMEANIMKEFEKEV